MDSLNNTQDQAKPINNVKPNSEEYSLAMVDTIFADTLSRGMQNAITSQQNAQMASSTSITNACARILQARASSPVTAPIPEPTETTPIKPNPAALKQVHDTLTAVDNTNHFSPNPSKPTSQITPETNKASASQDEQTSAEINKELTGSSKFKKRALLITLGILTAALITAGLYLPIQSSAS